MRVSSYEVNVTADHPQYILAIDLGTSGPKVALATTRAEIVAWERESTPLSLLPGGGAEQNPEDWWAAIKRATARLLAQAAVPVEDIIALCCTSQWSGTVAVDASGRPLRPAIIWMDSRGAPYVRQLTDGLPRVQGYGLGKLLAWIRLTGGVPGHSGKDSIAHILYLKHEQPLIYQQADKFLEPKDYLNWRLTGRAAASYDSITLHWLTDNRHVRRVVYSDRLLKWAGIERRKLPDLRPATDVLGPIQPEVAAELGLTPHVQVIMGAPDVHSAAIGSGALRDYEAHLYLGTSSWLSCHVPRKQTDLLHNMASFPSAIPGRYLLVNEQECAGVCLSYLIDHVLYPADELATHPRPPDVYDRLNRLAASVGPGSGRLIFAPWLNGERTPVEDHLVRGGFFNQSLQTTRAHLVRAVLEGVAYNSRWLLQCVEGFAGRRLDTLNVVGGGANSDLWCQIHADVLGRTIRQVKDPILANARGAAMLASVALGYSRFEEAAGQVAIAHTYQPHPDHHQLYSELFREFLNLYKRNRAIYARLNG